MDKITGKEGISLYPSFRMLLNYGEYRRIWPYANFDESDIYVTVGLARPFRNPICELLISRDYGESWSRLADFHAMDKRNTTTGQPFVTKERIIFVPVWSSGFYTNGSTWFTIYRSADGGLSWRKVYEDSGGTYGNHFFQNSANGKMYIGVGLGGGGSNGRISYTPAKSYLLESEDLGETWKKVLEVDYPTALYGGTALEEKTILVTARERKSIFKSVDSGNSWHEKSINKTARSISHIEELGKIVVTSNSSIFISDDCASTWTEFSSPVKGLALRYPILKGGKVYMTAVGWRSCLISTDMDKWYMNFDATGKVSGIFARMAVVDDVVFLGDEINGRLLKAKLPAGDEESISKFQAAKLGVEYLISMANYAARRILRQKMVLR